MKRITVLLAEDHTIVRQGLRAILGAESDIEVIGEAANGRRAVEMMQKLHPDVVVMDIAMPLLNGLEATRQILKLFPAAKILILSAHSDDEYIDRVIAIGAVGYLIKQSSAEFLSKAIREAQKGNLVYSPTVSRRLQTHATGSSSRKGVLMTNKAPRLTPREVELVQLVAEGKANKQIATELDISIKTVEKHRQSVMAKLDIHDTAGLTRYAISAGIIESSVQVTII
jgi:DNA-binding NarL/FixJ family response regulator